MRTLQKNEITIYLCNKYEENDKVLYKDPELINISMTTISNKWSIANLGPVINDTKNLISCDEEIMNKFHYGDKVYVYNEPVYGDKLASKADYEVVSIPDSLNVRNITIKKLIKNGI